MDKAGEDLFSDLESNELITEEKADGLRFVTNMPINKGFDEYANFFSSIGYIAQQIALIEDELTQSMMMITDDYDAVNEQLGTKNLGAILSLYELVFLARYGQQSELKKIFYAVKYVILKANKFRNEAVHSEWMFVESDAERPCYHFAKKGKSYYRIVSPKLMRKRAAFAHKVFEYVNDLRAITEGPIEDGWDPETIRNGLKNLRRLAKKVSV